METNKQFFFNVELKPYYFNEFIICGIPVPDYTYSRTLVLKFLDPEGYLNYINVLKIILQDLELVDPEKSKYEVQRSISFAQNILCVLNEHFSKRYN